MNNQFALAFADNELADMLAAHIEEEDTIFWLCAPAVALKTPAGVDRWTREKFPFWNIGDFTTLAHAH